MVETTFGLPLSPLALTATLLLVTVVHELGHLLMARLTRVPVKQISVGFGPVLWRWPMGEASYLLFRALPVGMAVGVPGRYDAEGQLRRPINYDLLIAAGGPLASFILSLLLVSLSRILSLSPTLDLWLLNTAILSTLIALLNLLPFPGLDGGHLAMLVAIKLGVRLSPGQEMALQRQGLRLLVVICVLLSIFSIFGFSKS